MDRLWLLFSITAFSKVTNAIRCRDIGWPDGPGPNDDGTPQTDPPYPDPFAPGQGWDIIRAQDCRVRFQTPGDRWQDPKKARIPTTKWTATPTQVQNTKDAYSGKSGNIMLWMRLNLEAFQYAGILTNVDSRAITAQEGLDSPNAVLSLSKS